MGTRWESPARTDNARPGRRTVMHPYRLDQSAREPAAAGTPGLASATAPTSHRTPASAAPATSARGRSRRAGMAALLSLALLGGAIGGGAVGASAATRWAAPQPP